VLNDRDLERYKRLLVTKRDELSAARDQGATVLPSASTSEGDFMDQASADAEAELQIQLRQTDGRLSKAIEDALARIRAGTFGICGACKGPIAKARLEAVPWTHLCRDCKERERA
jgi:DnaK suppressor protein